MAQVGIAKTQITTPAGVGKGSIAGSVVGFSGVGNLQNLNVSTQGALDWLIPFPGGFQTGGNKGNVKAQTVKLAGSLHEFFQQYGGTIGNQGSSSLTTSSSAGDTAGLAAAASAAFTAQSQADIANFNYGFEIQAPGSTKLNRNLNLYIGLWGGPAGQSRNAKIIATLTDESATELDLTFNDPGSNGVISVYKANFVYRVGTPGARLRVQVLVTGGTSVSNALGLQAATLF